MEAISDRNELLAQLALYLEELRATGVEDLYFALEPVASLPVAAPPAVSAPASSQKIPPITIPLPDAGAAAINESPRSLFERSGPSQARLFFVMAGAGFKGEAGGLLKKIVQAMNLSEGEIGLLLFAPDAIGDTLKSALLELLLSVRPEAVVAWGEEAARLLLGTTLPIAGLRGNFHDLEGIPLMPTLHPQALLKDPGLKRPVWEDMQQVMRLLGKTRP